MNKNNIKAKFDYCFNQLRKIIINEYFYQYLKDIKNKNNQIINSSKPFIKEENILCEYFPVIYFKNEHFSKLKKYNILIYTGEKKLFIDNLNNFLFHYIYSYKNNKINFYINIINLLISNIDPDQKFSFNNEEYIARSKRDKDFEIKTKDYYLYKNNNFFKLNFDILNYCININFYKEQISINKSENIKLNKSYQLVDITDFFTYKMDYDSSENKFILINTNNKKHLHFIEQLCLIANIQIIDLAHGNKVWAESRINYLKSKSLELLKILYQG